MGALKFDTTDNPYCLLIQLPDLGQKESSRELEIECKQWLLNERKVHVFDFKSVFRVEQNLLIQLMAHIKNLKRQEKTVHSLNLNTALTKEFRERGIITALNPIASLDELAPKTAPQKTAPQKMDVAYVKPFVDGAAKTFEVQVKLPAKPGKIAAKNHMYEANDAVVGRVTIDIPQFKGIISLCLSKEVFLKMYESILGDAITTIDKDSADAAGELMNMIYGYAKTTLNNDFGLQLKPIIPEVLLNPPSVKTNGQVIVVPFTTDAGTLRIEIYAN